MVLLIVLVPARPPRLMLESDYLWPGAPILVRFSEPLASNAIKDAFALYEGERQLAVRVELSPTGAVLFPQELLRSDHVYRLTATPLFIKNGTEATSRAEWQIRTVPERMFVLSEGGLYVVSLDGERSRVTEPNIVVTELVPGIEGAFVGAYHPLGDASLSGLFVGRMRQDGTVSVETFPATAKLQYSSLALCDRNTTLLMGHLDEGVPTLSALTVDWQSTPKLKPQFALRGAAVYGEQGVACSVDTARLLLRREDGLFVSAFLAVSETEMIGRYRETQGFFANDQALVMVDASLDSRGMPTARIDLLSSDGQRSITEEGSWAYDVELTDDMAQMYVVFIDDETFDTTLSVYAVSEERVALEESLTPPLGWRLERVVAAPDGVHTAVELSSVDNPYTTEPCVSVITDGRIGECLFSGQGAVWVR